MPVFRRSQSGGEGEARSRERSLAETVALANRVALVPRGAVGLRLPTYMGSDVADAFRQDLAHYRDIELELLVPEDFDSEEEREQAAAIAAKKRAALPLERSAEGRADSGIAFVNIARLVPEKFSFGEGSLARKVFGYNGMYASRLQRAIHYAVMGAMIVPAVALAATGAAMTIPAAVGFFAGVPLALHYRRARDKWITRENQINSAMERLYLAGRSADAAMVGWQWFSAMGNSQEPFSLRPRIQIIQNMMLPLVAMAEQGMKFNTLNAYSMDVFEGITTMMATIGGYSSPRKGAKLDGLTRYLGTKQLMRSLDRLEGYWGSPHDPVTAGARNGSSGVTLLAERDPAMLGMIAYARAQLLRSKAYTESSKKKRMAMFRKSWAALEEAEEQIGLGFGVAEVAAPQTTDGMGQGPPNSERAPAPVAPRVDRSSPRRADGPSLGL